jgi:uncharacterized protein YdhG (YjbR/CyaY superfamily)
MAEEFATVDDYISSFPLDVQAILQEVRRAIRNAAPAADEKISYQMPTIMLNGRKVVHFAAWKDHIGVYPIPTGDELFENDIAPYRGARSTARFPFSKPIPYDLLKRMVAFLVEERAGETTG